MKVYFCFKKQATIPLAPCISSQGHKTGKVVLLGNTANKNRVIPASSSYEYTLFRQQIGRMLETLWGRVEGKVPVALRTCRRTVAGQCALQQFLLNMLSRASAVILLSLGARTYCDTCGQDRYCIGSSDTSGQDRYCRI
jgi:hypothetical protein